MSDDRLFLPALLFDMKEAFGLGKALDFAREFGGQQIYLSLPAEPEHPVAVAFGLDLLVWLIGWHKGGGALVVPMGPASSHGRHQARQKALIRKLLRDGASTVTIVRAAECHERTIRRHRAALRDTPTSDPRQGTLEV